MRSMFMDAPKFLLMREHYSMKRQPFLVCANIFPDVRTFFHDTRTFFGLL
jgi:hypothetical protein